MPKPNYHFQYDIHKKEVIRDCSLTPTSISQEEARWLKASSNKYDKNQIDPKKSGKWMVFAGPNGVNTVWNKIKEAIKDGHIYRAEVSTKNREQKTHAIMIYTIDYEDLKDVINVLDFLDESGIKVKTAVIKYKAANQTKAGIQSGSGNSEPSWMYESNTIRKLARKTPN